MRLKLLSDEVESVVVKRSAVYGDPFLSFQHLAKLWTVLLENHYHTKLDHPLPPRMAALMMAMVKTLRASTTPHIDSHVDLAAFNQFACDFAHHEVEMNGGTHE